MESAGGGDRKLGFERMKSCGCVSGLYIRNCSRRQYIVSSAIV